MHPSISLLTRRGRKVRSSLKTVKVITLGCSKNTVDTEHLLAQLPEDAFTVVPESDTDTYVDVLLLNTCGFIGDAKQESIDEIFEAVELKKSGKAGEIYVFGCLSQRYMAEMPSLIPEVDKWFGARDLAPVASALGVEGPMNEGRYLTAPDLPYAYLKISEGCDRRCSYCAIPFIRGAHHSVPVEKLVAEAGILAAQGIRELILIAQDTTFYGLDIYHRRALAELLRKLSEVEGIERLRIHYSYPADFPEDVLDEMATNPKVCKYIDIPLQHISDRVLSRMHRGVDGDWTRNLIRKVREKVPGVVLRTTFIVGFPSETEEEFQELLDFVAEAEFDRMGAFAYSEEEGTFGAENFEDDVPEETKSSRLEKLMNLQAGISFKCNQKRIGTVERVLVDSCSGNTLICRSFAESPEVDGEILLQGAPRSLVGKFVDVRIISANEYDLKAELLQEC